MFQVLFQSIPICLLIPMDRDMGHDTMGSQVPWMNIPPVKSSEKLNGSLGNAWNAVQAQSLMAPRVAKPAIDFSVIRWLDDCYKWILDDFRF